MTQACNSSYFWGKAKRLQVQGNLENLAITCLKNKQPKKARVVVRVRVCLPEPVSMFNPQYYRQKKLVEEDQVKRLREIDRHKNVQDMEVRKEESRITPRFIGMLDN